MNKYYNKASVRASTCEVEGDGVPESTGTNRRRGRPQVVEWEVGGDVGSFGGALVRLASILVPFPSTKDFPPF